MIFMNYTLGLRSFQKYHLMLDEHVLFMCISFKNRIQPNLRYVTVDKIV